MLKLVECLSHAWAEEAEAGWVVAQGRAGAARVAEQAWWYRRSFGDLKVD